MLLRPSNQIIPALSASLMPSESASFLFSQRVLFTSHLDHHKKLILPPVSFTPIHYGPSNLPKGQSSEKFSVCLSPREFRPTFLSHSFRYSAVWLPPKLSSCISLHLSILCFSQTGLLVVSQTDILFLCLCAISFFPGRPFLSVLLLFKPFLSFKPQLTRPHL